MSHACLHTNFNDYLSLLSGFYYLKDTKKYYSLVVNIIDTNFFFKYLKILKNEKFYNNLRKILLDFKKALKKLKLKKNLQASNKEFMRDMPELKCQNDFFVF